MKSGYVTIMWNGRDRGAANEPPPDAPKAGIHPEKVMLCLCWVGRESSIRSSFWKTRRLIPTSAAPMRPAESSSQWKASRVHQQKTQNLPSGEHETECFLDDQTGQKLSQAGWEVLTHRCIHQTLRLRISVYSSLYKILLMEKLSVPWSTAEAPGMVLCSKR